MKVFYILASICLNALWVAPVYAVKTRTINLLVEQHSCFESRSFSGETLDGGNLTNFVDFKLPVATNRAATASAQLASTENTVSPLRPYRRLTQKLSHRGQNKH